MSMNKKKANGVKVSKTAIAFYVLSALLMIGFLLTVYNVTVYIQSLISAGSISLTANWMDVILYYVNNTAIYLALSAIVFGMGYVIAYIKGKNVKAVEDIIGDEVEEVVENDINEVSDILEETKTEEELYNE